MKQPAYSALLVFLLLGGTVQQLMAQGRVLLTADSVVLYQRHIGQTPGVYRYFRHFVGDVNNDKRPDIVVIAQNTQQRPDDPKGGFSRRVLLLLHQPNGQLRTAAYNDQLVACSTCGGGNSRQDPFTRVTINGNFLSFVSTVGFGEKTMQIVTFQFDPKRPDWWLHDVVLQPLAFDESGKLTKSKPPRTVDLKPFGEVRFETYTSKILPKK